MSYTQTPNYNLYKPTINSDNDQWGTHLNANSDTLDATLALLAPLASPALTGTPTAPTAAPATATTQLATTAFVTTALGGVPGGAVINPAPPTSPAAGELWWDSTGGNLYVYYNDGNSSQWVTAANMQGLANAATKADVAQAQNNVGRNVIHNPLFNIAQRGAGPFNQASGYGPDRWRMIASLDTVSWGPYSVTDAERAAIGDEAATLALFNTVTGNAGAAAYSVLTQPIENVRRLAGKTVVVSFYAVASAALKLGVSIDQSFGTGGSPSADVVGTGQSVQLTTSWARYSLIFTLPSAAGKTLGTNGDSRTAPLLWMSSGTTNAARAGNIGVQSGSINLWGVQLEIAQAGQTQPTPLEKPDPQQDLAKCQRFYQAGTVIAYGYQAASATFAASQGLPAQMRATPTINWGQSANNNVTSPAVNAINAATVSIQGTATGAGPYGLNLTFTASADL